jgi:CRISPR-associated endonuclease/helicase Cas3
LFTEAAPLDALRQRFGRLNRDGRPTKVSAAIIATKEEVGARADDPVYRTALRDAWLALTVAAGDAPLSRDRKRKRNADGEPAAGPVVDFGIAHFCVSLTDAAMSERSNAPVLMPAHLDLLVQTAPVPGNDPEISLYLHGPLRQPDAVTLIWRADLNAGNRGQDVARLLTLVPPRAGEGIELPVWVVRRWLTAPNDRIDTLADLPAPAPEDASRTGARGGVVSRRVFRWRGPDDDDSHWISGERVRSGDTIVVPASYGGVDEHGWDPSFTGPATDLADAAAEPHHSRYFALRVAPGLVGEVEPDRLADALAALRNERWETVRDGVCRLPLPAGLNSLLKGLCNARGRRGHPAVELYFDVYGARDDDAPQGLVLVAPQGLKRQRTPGLEDGFSPAATEDDFNGSAAGFAQSLKEHSTQVEARAEAFAVTAGLPPTRVADLKLAGWLHDQGKRDPRFQRWMHHGDPLGADPDNEDTVLAKSGRLLSPSAREKAGLPLHWRHEALSVRLARGEERLQQAHDAELVLWLVGTHHGRGRPLFPHADPMESAPDIGPQSLAFDWNGKNWPMLFDCLRARYGAWELAHMEAILRLADHRASEAAANAKENEA